MNTIWQKRWHENKSLIYFIVLMIVFRSSLADWNSVPTGSMKPTIVEGDRIFVNKIAYDLKLPLSHIRVWSWGNPERGDIVVFDSTIENTRLVKRVIGLPGDVIAMQNNQLFINGQLVTYTEHRLVDSNLRAVEQLVNHSHAMQISTVEQSSASSFDPVKVPAENYLVLGDNRDNSKDSRYIGFIPRNEIVGSARYLAFSLNYDNYYLPRRDRFFQALDVSNNSSN